METLLILAAIVVSAIILYNKLQVISIRIETLKKTISKIQEKLDQQFDLCKIVHTSPVEVIEKVENPVVISTIEETEVNSSEMEVEIEPIQTVPIVPDNIPETIEEIHQQKSPETPIPSVSRKQKINYEKFIGENLFGKIGILILVTGMGLFVKYAIDNEWINETMRTILGFLVGSGLLVLAERLHKKYRTFSSLLAGGAFAMFYVTTAIAYHYYGLFSQAATFIILVAATVLMSLLSLLYDRRELAAIALTGGFFAPFLTSSGEGNYIVLFTYILILNCGMFTLSVYKKWGELPLISFVFTWLCMLIYLLNTSVEAYSPFALLLFSTSYFVLFLFPVVLILKDTSLWINRILLGSIALNNFIYMAFGLHFLNALSIDIKLNGLLTLFIALINLGIAAWLKKQLNEYKLLLFAFLAIVVTFVSITIPLQLEGNYITIFWAAEMVLLLYLSIRSNYKLYEYFSYALVLLTFISWRMDTPDYYFPATGNTGSLIFANGYFITNLFTSLAFLCYAFLLRKYKMISEANQKFYTPLNAITLGAACLFFWYSLNYEFTAHISDLALSATIRFLLAGTYLFALSFALKKRFPLMHYTIGYIIAAGLNTAIYLFAFLTERENWTQPLCGILAWVYWLIIVAHLFYTSKMYYHLFDYRDRATRLYTVILNSVAAILLLTVTSLLLNQLSLDHEFNAGFSICLAITGFIQMSLGMRLHFRLLRVISLVTFGIILVKLLLFDLWLLPTIGKIIVFIILGIILLLLSFMYQKLKNVLFKEDQCEE